MSDEINWNELEKQVHKDFQSGIHNQPIDDEKEVDPEKFISDMKNMFPGTQIMGVLPTDPNNPNSGIVGLGEDGELHFGDGFVEL
jgi:hypothetical protein